MYISSPDVASWPTWVCVSVRTWQIMDLSVWTIVLLSSLWTSQAAKYMTKYAFVLHLIYTWIAKLFYSCSQNCFIWKMCLSQGLAALGTNHSLRKLTATDCVFITDHGIKVWFTFYHFIVHTCMTCNVFAVWLLFLEMFMWLSHSCNDVFVLCRCFADSVPVWIFWMCVSVCVCLIEPSKPSPSSAGPLPQSESLDALKYFFSSVIVKKFNVWGFKKKKYIFQAH